VDCVCAYCSVHSLSAANEANKHQLQKLQSNLAAKCEKHQFTANTVKRLSKKLLLVSKVLNSLSLLVHMFVAITLSGHPH